MAEAFAALRLLTGHPDIDAGRIVIVGFSFGGEVAHLSALESLRAALAPGTARFAAHVAYYPAGVYGVAAGPGSYTGAPILMLLGERDDNLPVAKAMDYVASAAAPFEVKIYPGAYHAWTVSTLGQPRFHPEYASTRKCPYVLLGQPVPVDPGVMATCIPAGRGYTMGYDEKMREAALRDTLDFLRTKLRL